MISSTSSLESRLEEIKHSIIAACQRSGRNPQEVTLVAVTKGFPASVIVEAHKLGIRYFGENRVQEAQEKFSSLPPLTPKPAWHLVGHLQTNKVKLALQLFDIIQSVDSMKLADLLDNQISRTDLPGRTGRTLPVFMEINTSGEITKFGFRPEEATKAFEHIAKLSNLEVRGLMTVAPLVSNPEEARPYFRLLKKLAGLLGLKELSMGMSDDYEVAVEEGATMIRIGRALFGERRME